MRSSEVSLGLHVLLWRDGGLLSADWYPGQATREAAALGSSESTRENRQAQTTITEYRYPLIYMANKDLITHGQVFQNEYWLQNMYKKCQGN